MVFHLVNQIRMTNVSFTYIISFDSDHAIEIYSIRVITKLPNSEQIKRESWSDRMVVGFTNTCATSVYHH
jgi:hypothetical protein